MKALVLACVLTVGVGAQAPAPRPDAQTPPNFKVEVWGFVMADFSARIDAYLKLRSGLEKGLPALKVTDDPAETIRAENLLAERIRQARRGARHGDIFTGQIRAGFREVLRSETTPGTCEQIGDDNPGEFSHAINGTYPKIEPVSTVPASMLDVLPRLPPDIQYRFLGHDLVLHDIKANVILDHIDDAIRCPKRR